MAITIQEFNASDLDYIAKMNFNDSTMANAINRLLAAQAATTSATLPASIAAFLEGLCDFQTSLIGVESYVPVGVSTNLTVAPGTVFKSSNQTIVQSIAPVVLSFSGLGAATYYIDLDVTGTPIRAGSPGTDSIYSVQWSGSAFGTITRIAPALFTAQEEDDARKSDAQALEFNTLDDRLEAVEGTAVTAFNNATDALAMAALATGDLVGPGGATDNAIARYDGVTGKLVQDSAVIVQDDGRISSVTDPSSAQDAATKNYVDNLAINLGKRSVVRVATIASITIATALNNGDSLDGVTLATSDLVLVKDQAAPEQNGIYVVGVSPVRVSEYDTYDEHPGALISVQEGGTNADTLWLCTSNAGGTLNTTALSFSALSVSAAITQLTGDVTAGPGSGSQAATIANDAVTFAKMQNIATDSLLGRDTASAGDPENILLNATLEMDGAGNLRRAALTGDITVPAGSNASTLKTAAKTREIVFTIDGAGSVIATGLKDFLPIVFDCTIIGWTLISADAAGPATSGSIVIDIWKDVYANYPPTVADTLIPSGTKPTITTATKAVSSSMTGWTTTITAGDVLAINVDSVTTLTKVKLVLTVTI